MKFKKLLIFCLIILVTQYIKSSHDFSTQNVFEKLIADQKVKSWNTDLCRAVPNTDLLKIITSYLKYTYRHIFTVNSDETDEVARRLGFIDTGNVNGNVLFSIGRNLKFWDFNKLALATLRKKENQFYDWPSSSFFLFNSHNKDFLQDLVFSEDKNLVALCFINWIEIWKIDINKKILLEKIKDIFEVNHISKCTAFMDNELIYSCYDRLRFLNTSNWAQKDLTFGINPVTGESIVACSVVSNQNLGLLAVALDNQTINIYETANLKLKGQKSLIAHFDAKIGQEFSYNNICKLIFSPDNKILLSCASNQVKLWNIEQLLNDFKNNKIDKSEQNNNNYLINTIYAPYPIKTLFFLANGQYLIPTYYTHSSDRPDACLGRQDFVTIWDLKHILNSKKYHDQPEFPEELNNLIKSHNLRELVDYLNSNKYNDLAKFPEVLNNILKSQKMRYLLDSTEHKEDIKDLTFSPDDKYLITSTLGGIKIYKDNSLDLESDQNNLNKISDRFEKILRSDLLNRKSLAPTLTAANHAKIWDITRGSVDNYKTSLKNQLNPDNIYRAQVRINNQIKLNGQSLFDFTDKDEVDFLRCHTILKNIETNSFKIINDTLLWFIENRRIRLMASHEHTISAIAINSDNNLVVTASTDGNIVCWNLLNNIIQCFFSGNYAEIKHIRFITNNSFETIDANKETLIWKIDSEKQVVDSKKNNALDMQDITSQLNFLEKQSQKKSEFNYDFTTKKLFSDIGIDLDSNYARKKDTKFWLNLDEKAKINFINVILANIKLLLAGDLINNFNSAQNLLNFITNFINSKITEPNLGLLKNTENLLRKLFMISKNLIDLKLNSSDKLLNTCLDNMEEINNQKTQISQYLGQSIIDKIQAAFNKASGIN